MSIGVILVVFLVVGVVLFLINRFIPMDANVKKLLNYAVVGFLILWVAVGLFGPMLRGVMGTRVGG